MESRRELILRSENGYIAEPIQNFEIDILSLIPETESSLDTTDIHEPIINKAWSNIDASNIKPSRTRSGVGDGVISVITKFPREGWITSVANY